MRGVRSMMCMDVEVLGFSEAGFTTVRFHTLMERKEEKKRKAEGEEWSVALR